MNERRVRAELESVLREALAAVAPRRAVQRVVSRWGDDLQIDGRPLPASVRLRVVAVGKAAAAMAAEIEGVAGDRIAWGLALTKDGHGVPLSHCELRESGHPVPDARGVAAAGEILARVIEAPAAEPLLVLLSGGASALATCPLPGLSLDELARTTSLLLESGAPIDELNAVRKHLTALSGGRLAAAAPARRIEVLAISDVVGDRLDVIGSGPCAPDPSTFADALAVLDRRALRASVPPAVLRHLESGERGAIPETPKPGDPIFERVHTSVIASNHTALEAARCAASDLGLRPLVVSESLQGEARDAGRRLAALARSLRVREATCLLVGGETAVHVRGNGRGGRNQELVLAAALELRGTKGISLLAAGTDGTDGPTDAAGAYADGETVSRGEAAGVDPAGALAENDAYTFFDREGGLLRTGPTRTNVMDLVLVRIDPSSRSPVG